MSVKLQNSLQAALIMNMFTYGKCFDFDHVVSPCLSVEGQKRNFVVTYANLKE